MGKKERGWPLFVEKMKAVDMTRHYSIEALINFRNKKEEH